MNFAATITLPSFGAFLLGVVITCLLALTVLAVAAMERRPDPTVQSHEEDSDA